MARKTSLSLETLVALGAEKLAQIVLDDAMANAPFRKNEASNVRRGENRPSSGARHRFSIETITIKIASEPLLDAKSHLRMDFSDWTRRIGAPASLAEAICLLP